MNIFGEVRIAHKSLSSSGISSKGQIPRFHTLGFVQGMEVELDEHRKIATMFQHASKYNVQMKNIFLRLFNVEIKDKQIIKEKDKFVQNFQGALEKE